MAEFKVISGLKSTNSIFHRVLSNFKKITPGVVLAYTLLLTPVYSQQIVVDGDTNTSLQTNGNLTKVTTSTTKGNNAFNSFSKFNVDSNKTVNLIFPGETQNLINVIKSEQSIIDGTLNAVQNNHIGGNMFLVNPYGVIIGTEGVINTGSLTIATPTSDTVNTFFSSPGVVNDTSVNMLLNGNMPTSKDSVINVNGKINAITDVHLSANKVVTTGLITTNAIFDEQNIDIGDVVNLNTLKYQDNDTSKLVLNNGTISIKSTSSVNISGSIYSGEDIFVDICSEDSSAYMTFSKATARANNITLNSVAGTYENKTLLESDSLNLNAVIRINSSSLTALNDLTLTTTGGNISNINVEPESYFSASVIGASAITYSKFNVGNNLNISIIGGNISNLNAINSGDYTLLTSAVSQFTSYGSGSSSIIGKTATFENLGGIISGTKTMSDNNITEEAYVLMYLPTIVTGEDLIVTAKGGQVIGLEDYQQSIANVSSTINIVSVPISVNGNMLIENIAGVAKYVYQVSADANLSTTETRSGYITSQQKIEIFNQVNPGAIIAQSGHTYSNISLSDINISSKKGVDLYAQIIDLPINSYIDFSSKIDLINSASIISSDNINLTTPGIITINGTISLEDASGLNKDLIINEDNTIDPLSTIGAILQDNLFIVEDTSLINSVDYNKLINLNGEIKGTGKIITSAGPLSINIVNNSDSDIVINNLKAVIDSYENIFNNGKSINIASISQTIQHNYSSPSVNITSKEGTSIILNGNIESIADLGQILFLTINADNSIDTINAIKTQIDNNIITVSDINLTGLSSYINISGNLHGTGTIKSVAFIPEVKIINNSQNDLNIKGIQISELEPPHIVINNEELDSNIGNITITKTYSGGTGNIVINNTTNTDILISENISNPSYDVYLTNKYGDILLYDAPYIITAKNIFLTATEGSIGIPDVYINIDENDLYGSITASSAGNICLREISGDMRIGTLNSQNGDIYLSVRDGGVISASSSNIDNISGRNLYIGNPKNYYFLDIYGTLYRPKDFLGFLFDTLKTSGSNWANIDDSKYTFLDTNNITKEEVISYFEQYSKIMTDEDVFMICYMGHGGGGGDPNYPYNDNHDIGTDDTPIDENNGIARDVGDEYIYFEQGFTITDDEFAQSLKNTKGTIVFFSDQCHGGGMFGGDADLNAIADQNGFKYFSIAGNREGLYTYIDTYVANDGHKYYLVGENYIMLIKSLIGTDLQYPTCDYNLNPIVVNIDPAINSDDNVYLNEWYNNTFKQVMYNNDAEPNYPITFLSYTNMSDEDFKNNPIIYGGNWNPLSHKSPVALVGTKNTPLMLNMSGSANIFAKADINLSGKIEGNRIFTSQNGSINLSGDLINPANTSTTENIYINNNNTQYLFSRKIDIVREYYEELQNIFAIFGEDFIMQNIFEIPEKDLIFSSNNNSNITYMGYETSNNNVFQELQNNEYTIIKLQEAIEAYKETLKTNISKSTALKQAAEYLIQQKTTSGTLKKLLKSTFGL